MTKISVLTATYNAGTQLPDLIHSLRQQTGVKMEWIVIDGGSTDQTCQLLADASDVVTSWVSEPDFGIYHALNKALRLATGDFYVVAGSDDTFTEGALARFAHAAAESDADVIAAPVWVDGRRIEPRRTWSWLHSGPPGVAAHSVGTLIRRTLHDEFGNYSRRFPIAADTLFLLTVAKAGRRFWYVDDPAGSFGTQGVSSHDMLGGLSESMRVNIRVRGMWPLFFGLFVLRVLRHARRIGERS